MLSAKVSSPPGEKLTPSRWMGDDSVFNVVFSLEALPRRFSAPKFTVYVEFIYMVST